MAKLTLNSAGVSVTEIDKSGPLTQEPTGIPAGVIGIASKGPAFVPVTLGVIDDFNAKFGMSDGRKFGPIAVNEWLKNAGSATYLRVLGAGNCEKRTTTGNSAGAVTSAGFVVGEQQPNDVGLLTSNPYANENGVLGRTYFLGCYMSESQGSTYLSDAGFQTTAAAAPIIRAIVLAPSGVVLRLSHSNAASAPPGATDIATDAGGQGSITGSLVLLQGGVAKQEFVMLLNGHKGADSNYPNVITASFDPTAQNYLGNVLNKDPYKYQQAGHYLYIHYDVHPALAAATGSGLLSASLGAGAATTYLAGAEPSAFMTTGSAVRNTGTTTVPNYENFEDRFSAPSTPWIVSQKFGGTPENLFKVESLDDGDYASAKYKISIENIAASIDTKDQYGTFDLVVRSIDDVDDDYTPIEEFRGLSLNPDDDRYVARAIGDMRVYFDFDKATSSQKLVVEGTYENKSNYIRVTMADKVNNVEVDATALPFGFRGHPHLVTSGSAPLTAGSAAATEQFVKRAVQPPVAMRLTLANGVAPKKQVNSNLYWGVKFQQTTDVADTNKGKLFDKTIANMAKYLPGFMTSVQNVVAKDNTGAAVTGELGIVDADIFANNMFTLENVKVTTGSDLRADPKTAVDWTYVRRGGVTADDVAKTRGMSAEDLKKQSVRAYAKFSLHMYGGFNGVNPFDRDEAELTNAAIVEEMNNTNRGLNEGPTVKAYTKALEIMSNTADVDIQLLAIPGIRHSVVTDAASQAVEARFDAMYLMDIESYDELNSLVTSSVQTQHVANTVTAFSDRALDTNFVASYYPDMIVEDPTTQTNMQVPPSVVVLGAYALNDAIGYPWFAPAGFKRGKLAASEAVVKLSRENLDALYSADINPIVAFPNSGGPVVWGQKTLQRAKSALDRVNVRRLLIEVRRQAREIANTITFEPGREATLALFESRLRPRMESIQSRRGLKQFKIVVDTSTTTKSDIENNTIRGKVYVAPTRTVEFVSIDFEVTNANNS